MKKLALIIFPLLFVYAGIAQSIQGIIKDEKTQKGLPFANVILLQDNKQMAGLTTDLDGNYKFSDIKAGTYDVEVAYVGYPNQRITEINVSKAAIEVNIEMDTDRNLILFCGPSIRHTPPLIQHDDTSTGIKMKSNEIMRMP